MNYWIRRKKGEVRDLHGALSVGDVIVIRVLRLFKALKDLHFKFIIYI